MSTENTEQFIKLVESGLAQVDERTPISFFWTALLESWKAWENSTLQN